MSLRIDHHIVKFKKTFNIMKKILILILALTAGYSAFAQQKGKTKNMTITIYEFHGIKIGSMPNMIITRDDTLQEQKNIDLHFHVKPKEQLAAHENALMQALKPYYDSGWKLVSSSVEVTTFQGSDYDKTYRYYLAKDRQ
jgi:hypothetical protein